MKTVYRSRLKKTAVIRWRQHRHARTREPGLIKAATAIAPTFRIVTEPLTDERYIGMTMHFAGRSEQHDLSGLILLCHDHSLSGRLVDQAHHRHLLRCHFHADLLVFAHSFAIRTTHGVSSPQIISSARNGYPSQWENQMAHEL